MMGNSEPVDVTDEDVDAAREAQATGRPKRGKDDAAAPAKKATAKKG